MMLHPKVGNHFHIILKMHIIPKCSYYLKYVILKIIKIKILTKWFE